MYLHTHCHSSLAKVPTSYSRRRSSSRAVHTHFTLFLPLFPEMSNESKKFALWLATASGYPSEPEYRNVYAIPLSLSCVPVAQHKHHESQLRSLWGAQTRRNQASWLIVDYHKTHCGYTASVLVFHRCATSAFVFADLSIYGLGSKVALSQHRRGCGRDA